ncbi:MAG: response regulator [Limisphaerales bacterium]
MRFMSHDATQPTPAPQQGQPRQNYRILLADDETSLRDFMKSVLAQSGYHVDAAQDGALAWAALQTETYDLLITDYKMPKMSGIELVRNLRSAGMALPVIVVTGTLPAYDLSQNTSLQIAATLAKPFTVPELLETVGKVLAAAVSPHAPLP